MDAKDEVKQRLSVEDVIADYLELKRAGRNFKAISPFSNERTPSFMVSPEKQIWHDFSSNKGGDMFSFIMEVEGVDFREALEILAKKANVELSQYQKQGSGEAAKLKKKLLEAHVAAVQFYHLSLSRKPEALKYVKENRGFTPETIRQWQLGYSPEDGKSLLNALKKRGFSELELSKAGLITKGRDGPYSNYRDMFRGRIMIPLADGQGNVVGFTARLLKDIQGAPKYFNTPQTPIYDKGRQVFGLHHAKEAIRSEDKVVLVEGNLDVITSHQEGVANVVAAAGTAMTADHLKSLRRLTENLVLAFDADSAGLKATERAIPIAQEVGMEFKILRLPSDVKDPDELIQTDLSAWKKAIEGAEDAALWTLQEYSKLYNTETASGKTKILNRVIELIAAMSDEIKKDAYTYQLNVLFGLDAHRIKESIQSTQKRLAQKDTKKSIKAGVVSPDTSAYEDDLLALNAQFPGVRESLTQIKDQTLGSNQREAVKSVLLDLPQHEILDPAQADRLNLDENYVKILLLTAEEKYASWTPADVMAEAMALARRIVTKSKEQYKNQLTAEIREAESSGDHKKAAELLDLYQKSLKKE